MSRPFEADRRLFDHDWSWSAPEEFGRVEMGDLFRLAEIDFELAEMKRRRGKLVVERQMIASRLEQEQAK